MVAIRAGRRRAARRDRAPLAYVEADAALRLKFAGLVESRIGKAYTMLSAIEAAERKARVKLVKVKK